MNPPNSEPEAIALLYAALWPFVTNYNAGDVVSSRHLRLAHEALDAVGVSLDNGTVKRASAVQL